MATLQQLYAQRDALNKQIEALEKQDSYVQQDKLSMSGGDIAPELQAYLKAAPGWMSKNIEYGQNMIASGKIDEAFMKRLESSGSPWENKLAAQLRKQLTPTFTIPSAEMVNAIAQPGPSSMNRIGRGRK